MKRFLLKRGLLFSFLTSFILTLAFFRFFQKSPDFSFVHFFFFSFGLIFLFFLFFFRKDEGLLKHLHLLFKQIAEGNFQVSFETGERKELSDLASTFHRMIQSLQESFCRLKHEKQELQSVFSVMSEILWIVDSENRIVFANAAFYEFSNVSNVKNEFYWRFIRNANIDTLIKEVRKQQKRRVIEVRENNATYLCTADFLPLKKNVIVILNEISEIKEAEAFKRTLVMNASHELKTPLTSIKGFVETLINEEKDPFKLRYLSIIERNANRLSNIIQDLLLLSGLEESSLPLQKENCNLSELIQGLIPIFEKETKAKGIYLKTQLDSDLILSLDPFKIEQVMINLIQNAIHYTEKGGILISLLESPTQVIVSVEDTGIGIPEDQIQRIFDRFYVIDKSRSRQVGGTGLGLSIVRHIVELHGGKVRVKSTPGKGSCFSFNLPR